jgi:hypothetical protein
MNLIQINKFSNLHNGSNVFFCKTDFILLAFDEIKKLKNDVVFISGNSDYCITDEQAEKAPKNIIKWFCQNRISHNPLLESIPIGIENTIECKVKDHGYVWKHAYEKSEILESNPLKREKLDNLCYANFNLNTNYNNRSNLKSYISQIKHISWKEPFLNYIEFVQDILNHEAVICPQGNGIGDNHRIYETLYCGRIPITFNPVQFKFLHKLFPVLLIEDFEQLCDEKWLKNKINSIEINHQYLNCNYWLDKIANHAKECNFIA